MEAAETATTMYTTYFSRWKSMFATFATTASGKNMVTTASADVTMDTVILRALRTVVRPGSDFCLTRAAMPLSIMTVLLMMPLTVTARYDNETTPSDLLALKRHTNEVTSDTGTATMTTIAVC